MKKNTSYSAHQRTLIGEFQVLIYHNTKFCIIFLDFLRRQFIRVCIRFYFYPRAYRNKPLVLENQEKAHLNRKQKF